MLRKCLPIIIGLVTVLGACSNHELPVETKKTIRPSDTVSVIPTNILAKPDNTSLPTISSKDITLTPEKNTTIDTTPTPKIIATDAPFSEPKLITTGNIVEIWWAEDSQSFQFSLLLGDEEIMQFFELESNELILMNSQPGEIDGGLNVAHLKELENIGRYSISPSGKITIYATSSEATSTPPSDEGEYWSLVGDSELFLFTNGETTFIGEVNNCIDKFIWSNDETKVLSISLPRPAPCMKYPAWLIDLENLEVIPILGYPNGGQVVIHGFSPDSNKLLFNHNRILYIFDTDSLQSFELALPYLMGDSQWIEDDRLLVSFKKDRLSSSSIGILHLDTMEIISIVDPIDLFGSSDYRIGLRSLSPDEKWIAFVKEGIYDNSMSLWIKRLE